ncbi:MAG: hypothetical protein ACTSP4_10500 [Candidatus Hodarchaeales archaeon]
MHEEANDMSIAGEYSLKADKSMKKAVNQFERRKIGKNHSISLEWFIALILRIHPTSNRVN